MAESRDGMPDESGPDMTAILIIDEIGRYRQTGDGESLMKALDLYFRMYARRGGPDVVVEAVAEAFLRAWERWTGGRMDPWDPRSAPVRRLGQAFGVADRDGRWRPGAATAWLPPLNARGKRTSPGGETRAIWTEESPARRRRSLRAEDIPLGMSLHQTIFWTVEKLRKINYIVSNDPDHPRNVFVRAEKLLKTRGLGWSRIRTLYNNYPAAKQPRKKRSPKADISKATLPARAAQQKLTRKRRK